MANHTNWEPRAYNQTPAPRMTFGNLSLQKLANPEGWQGLDLYNFLRYIQTLRDKYQNPEKALDYLDDALRLSERRLDWETHDALCLTKTPLSLKVRGPALTLQWLYETIEQYDNDRIHAPDDLFLNRAKLLQGAGRHVEAARDFKHILERHEHYAGAMHGLLRNLSSAGSTSTFLHYANIALEKWPNENSIIFWAAKAHLVNGDHDKAKALFAQCSPTKKFRNDFNELAIELAETPGSAINDHLDLAFGASELSELSLIEDLVETDNLESVYGL